ncbi:MAG: lipid IV(A) 3-deoxy-D-manno-octulosonic acid transferase [Methylophaga sp.]|nr:lipid IV(A) 3-deoxy-D-manno-octulosonic acid transferase [Methylophaga sp.]
MRLFYTTLFCIGIPFIILRLIWRGFSVNAYWHRWAERFGKGPVISDDAAIIWIHAVSVGEVEACRPLVKQLRTEYPDHQLLITTMTPTGSERVKLLFENSVFHCYLPYDLPFAIKRFLNRTKPQFGIIMETEIWPNLIYYCHKRNIPLVLANARLSERSTKGYAHFPEFIKETLQNLPLIAAQGQDDRKRFQQLGANIENVHAIGNLKYEITLPASLTEQADAMRHLWDSNRPVWVAASTHEGEEEMVINAARQVRALFPNLLLIIVPRHPQRFDRVAALAGKAGFKTLRRSDQQACPADVQILVVDTMGELPLFYAASDVAFVGGSLVPHGGHNVLEPAALGRAIVTGPHYFNFNEITTDFLRADAIIEVSDIQSLADTTIKLLQNPQQRAQMGEAALQLIAGSQSASTHLINLIKYNITHHAPD